jgi:hypothetical protein
MKKSRQNKVPEEFISFYQPQLKLKQLLQSGESTIDERNNESAVIGLMVLHYATFFIGALYRQDKIANERVLLTRHLIEAILKGDEYKIHEHEVSKLISFIDLVGKLINTTILLKIHIAMYNGYLDYEIYYAFNKHKKLFDFKGYCTLSDDIVARMKDYSNASQELLNTLNKK